MKNRLQRKPDAYWLPHPSASGAYQHWLIDEGSLTRRLQSRCANFQVRGVSQRRGLPLPDESALLGLRRGQTALIREVWLHDGDTALVFARSVLPSTSLYGAWRDLGRLGSRPLGAALFTDMRVVRRPLAYRKLKRGHVMLKKVLPDQALWARRSVFLRDCHAILVTEAFLPAILDL